MTSRKTYLTNVAFVFLLLLIILLISSAQAAASGATIQDEPYRVETFDINAAGKLNVNTSGGYITVKGSSSNSVRVEMYVRKNGRNYLPEDTNLDEWEINISESGNTVKAKAKRRDNGWSLFGRNNFSISFVVYTPREISTDLNTSGGHIKIHGLEGNQQLATSGGHLNMSNLKGTVNARTSGGYIELSDVQGDVEARTSGGYINVENATGKLAVKTSGGQIDLKNVNGSIKARTSGGRISASLTSIDQFVDLRTSGGNVSIGVPANIGLDLDLRGSYVNTQLENFSGKVDRDEVEGKLNGGGPMLSARTSGGTVSLSFQ